MQAPEKKGIVKYSVILTSDSYIGLSTQQELKVSHCVNRLASNEHTLPVSSCNAEAKSVMYSVAQSESDQYITLTLCVGLSIEGL